MNPVDASATILNPRDGTAAHLESIPMVVSPLEKFREFLWTRQMRLTPERTAIVEAVYATHEHFDAEQWVENFARERKHTASRSTIYRTIRLLEEAGLIRRVARSNGREVYEHDYGYPQHDHLICRTCGEMIEFSNEQISQLVETIARENGFRVTGHRMEVDGICEACSRPPQRRHRKLDMI